jgi:ABC-type tungstate transport system substrate-binding protein
VRSAAVLLLVWGLWLAVLTGVQAVFAPKLIQFSIPAVASVACVLVGLAVWVLDVRQGPGEGLRLITDSSVATVVLIVGVAVALLGAGFGLWLILIGAGITALGFGGVVREQRARSRTLRKEGSR